MKETIIPVVAAVIRNHDHEVLITKRPPNGHLAGLWEFPGGKIEAGETPEQALQRELLEELGVRTETKKLMWQETFTYPEKTVHIRFFECILLEDAENIKPIQVADFKWVPVEALSQFEFPPADAAFIELLTNGG